MLDSNSVKIQQMLHDAADIVILVSVNYRKLKKPPAQLRIFHFWFSVMRTARKLVQTCS